MDTERPGERAERFQLIHARTMSAHGTGPNRVAASRRPDSTTLTHPRRFHHGSTKNKVSIICVASVSIPCVPCLRGETPVVKPSVLFIPHHLAGRIRIAWP